MTGNTKARWRVIHKESRTLHGHRIRVRCALLLMIRLFASGAWRRYAIILIDPVEAFFELIEKKKGGERKAGGGSIFF